MGTTTTTTTTTESALSYSFKVPNIVHRLNGEKWQPGTEMTISKVCMYWNFNQVDNPYNIPNMYKTCEQMKRDGWCTQSTQKLLRMAWEVPQWVGTDGYVTALNCPTCGCVANQPIRLQEDGPDIYEGPNGV